MSHITRADVLKLADLSKIKLSDREIDKFVVELDTIVGYVEQINSVDTKNLKPTDQVTGLVNIMRKDEVIDYGPLREDLLKNAPATERKYIKVKRILE